MWPSGVDGTLFLIYVYWYTSALRSHHRKIVMRLFSVANLSQLYDFHCLEYRAACLQFLATISVKPIAEPVAPRKSVGTSPLPNLDTDLESSNHSTDEGGENFGPAVFEICRAEKKGGLRGSCGLPPLCALSCEAPFYNTQPF